MKVQRSRGLPILLVVISATCLSALLFAGQGGKGRRMGERPAVASAKVGFGLRTVSFETSLGEVRVLLPATLHAGDRISARVERRGDAGLGLYSVSIEGVEAMVEEGAISVRLPRQDWALVELALRNPSGEQVAKQALPLYPEGSLDELPSLELPNTGVSGGPLSIRGTRFGDPAVEVWIGGERAPILSSSSREAVVRAPSDVVGLADVMVRGRGFAEAGELRLLRLGLGADVPALRPGEDGNLSVRVEGLGGLSEPLALLAVNRTPEVVALKAGQGAVQRIDIDPVQVSDGVFQASLRMRGVSLGTFEVSLVVVEPGDEDSHVPNVSPTPHLALVTSPPGHVANLSWPTHLKNVTWPPHETNVSWATHFTDLTWGWHLTDISDWFPPRPTTGDPQDPDGSSGNGFGFH